ncbi:MAG TPA: hypothetical protein PLC61_04830 [Chitinophagales bacterium]|nr:hypothetical protein [Chitinophagales bacterium]MCB9074115.1 hypothetical protein [Chitinophagales bacterium]HMU97299.1 hypothetical protein [Chitinophagales bacterium]HMV03678.1 hypothetical protein [Chitinophagales bacterium]HMW95246.1 hypothetical protein [Chitinophagales bacterium]
MKKQTLLIGIFSVGNIVLAKEVSKSRIQETANNIATELQIPAAQRVNFTNEYTSKSIAIQDIVNKNVTPQEKVNQIKMVLNQSSANLKQVTPVVQQNRYSNYFNKQVQMTAKVETLKSPASKNDNVNTKPNTPTSNNTNSAYTKNADYNNLPQEHQAVMDNIGKQLVLDNNQFGKMSSDYLNFVTTTESIAKTNGKNLLKAKTEFDQLTASTLNSTKGYLSTEQYNAFQTLLKTGKLGKDTNPRVNVANTNTTNNTTIVNNNKNLSDIKSAETLTQLKSSLNLSPTQYANALKVANNYDAEIAKVSAMYPNNIKQQKSELDKKTPMFVNQFKAALNPAQANSFFGVIIAQVNILTGENLTTEQQQLISAMRNNYKMNDVQIVQSMFALAEAKVKADANKMVNKANPQVFNQENQKILSETDNKIKNILTPEQYNKVKADIEKALK